MVLDSSVRLRAGKSWIRPRTSSISSVESSRPQNDTFAGMALHNSNKQSATPTLQNLMMFVQEKVMRQESRLLGHSLPQLLAHGVAKAYPSRDKMAKLQAPALPEILDFLHGGKG